MEKKQIYFIINGTETTMEVSNTDITANVANAALLQVGASGRGLDEYQIIHNDHILYWDKPLLDQVSENDVVFLSLKSGVGGDVDAIIKNIPVNPSNFEHIANTGTINGTLLVDLRKILKKILEPATPTTYQEGIVQTPFCVTEVPYEDNGDRSTSPVEQERFTGGYQPTDKLDTSNPPRQAVEGEKTAEEQWSRLITEAKIGEAADGYARQQNAGSAGSGIIQESFIQGAKFMQEYASLKVQQERNKTVENRELEKYIESRSKLKG